MAFSDIATALAIVATTTLFSNAQYIPSAPQGDLIELVLTFGDRFAVQRVVACRLQDAVASPTPLASRLVRLQATLPILANASFVVVPASTLRQLPQKAPLDGRLLTLCEFDGSIDVRDRVVLLDVLDSPPSPCSLQDEFGDTVPLLATSLLASGAKAVLITTIASVGYSARFTSAQYYSTLLVRSYGVSSNMLEAPLFKMLKKDFATLKAQVAQARLVSLGGTTSVQSVDVNDILGIPLVCLATLSCFLASIFGALITSFGVILFVIILTSNAKTTTVQLAFGACSLSYGWCVLVSGATACDNYTVNVMWASLILDSLALFFFVLSILLIAHTWASTIAPTLVNTSALKPWMLTGAFWVLFGVDVVACILLCIRSLLRSPLAGRAVALALVALVSLALVISGAVFVYKFSSTDANERYRRVIRFTTALLIAFSVLAAVSVTLSLLGALALTGDLVTALASEQLMCSLATAAALFQYAALVALQAFMFSVKMAQRTDASFASSTSVSRRPSMSTANTSTATNTTNTTRPKSGSMTSARDSTDSARTVSSEIVVDDMDTRASFYEAGH